MSEMSECWTEGGQKKQAPDVITADRNQQKSVEEKEIEEGDHSST